MAADVSAFDAAVCSTIHLVSGLFDAFRQTAIAEELVRLTLGARGPRRPELLVDELGKQADEVHWSWMVP